MEPDVRKKDAPKKHHETHPSPQVIARPATQDEIPPVAARMAAVAQAAGWDVTITYARGTTDSTKPTLAHSIAVRATRGAQRAVAVWTAPVATGKWTFKLGARAGRWQRQDTGEEGVLPVLMANAELKTYLSSPSPIAPSELPGNIWEAGDGFDTSVMELFTGERCLTPA